MTDEERRIISEYVTRVAGAAQAAAPAGGRPGGPWGGRVPSTQAPQPPLPPMDRDADALLQQLFQQYPEARYRLTQTAFVQEHALVQAQNRIQELEWEVEAAQRQTQASQNRGFLGLGGTRPAPMPARPQPMTPPGGPMNPAMMQQGRQGPGFLATAAMTAAGVAGGMVLGNMLMGALGGGGAAAAATGGSFGQEAVPTSSAWTDPGAASPSSGFGGNDAAGAYDDAGGAGYDDAAGSYDGGGYDEDV